MVRKTVKVAVDVVELVMLLVVEVVLIVTVVLLVVIVEVVVLDVVVLEVVELEVVELEVVVVEVVVLDVIVAVVVVIVEVVEVLVGMKGAIAKLKTPTITGIKERLRTTVRHNTGVLQNVLAQIELENSFRRCNSSDNCSFMSRPKVGRTPRG